MDKDLHYLQRKKIFGLNAAFLVVRIRVKVRTKESGVVLRLGCIGSIVHKESAGKAMRAGLTYLPPHRAIVCLLKPSFLPVTRAWGAHLQLPAVWQRRAGLMLLLRIWQALWDGLEAEPGKDSPIHDRQQGIVLVGLWPQV